jgi:hypothetical protein
MRVAEQRFDPQHVLTSRGLGYVVVTLASAFAHILNRGGAQAAGRQLDQEALGRHLKVAAAVLGVQRGQPGLQQRLVAVGASSRATP